MPNDELFHHGIDGQKWGVRHGPPYPLDREDHNEIVERSHDATKKRHLSYERSGKYAKRMTDKDLNDTIDRLQREETYRKLVSKEREEKKAAKLAKRAKKEADERYKNQNELTKKQQELQEQQQKANKKANSIARKVIENLLTKAASTAGTQVTKHLIEKHFNKPNDENTDNTDNTNIDNKPKNQDVSKKKDTEKQLEALKKRQKELESKPNASRKKPEVPLTLPNVTTNNVNPADIPKMSENEINQTLIEMYNGVYWSDESAGACL